MEVLRSDVEKQLEILNREVLRRMCCALSPTSAEGRGVASASASVARAAKYLARNTPHDNVTARTILEHGARALWGPSGEPTEKTT